MYRLLPKICDWVKYQNRQSSKSIRVIKMSFCQSESFWQKKSLVTHIFLIYVYHNIQPSCKFRSPASRHKALSRIYILGPYPFSYNERANAKFNRSCIISKDKKKISKKFSLFHCIIFCQPSNQTSNARYKYNN